MKILLFGATGKVGDGVLRRLIASPKVSRVIAVSRKPLAVRHPKLETVIAPDMFDLQHVDSLEDLDACFFCPEIRVWSSSTSPATALTRSHAEMGAGQGRNEDGPAQHGIPRRLCPAAGFIQPMRGAARRLRSVRGMYALTAPFYPLLQWAFSRFVTSTDLLA